MSGPDRPRDLRGSDPPDGIARRRATTEFDRNLVVTAGAGTGKTALLVERTLNLLGSGTATLDALALITFTEKAAAELRLRLGAGLDRLLVQSGGDDRDHDFGRDADRSWVWLRERGETRAAIRARVLQALAALDAASVGTIHAFCLDLLRRHPRAAGIDPRSAVGEESAMLRLFDETWEAFLRGPDGPAGRAEAWRRAVALAVAPEPARHLGQALSRFALPAEALEAGAVPASGSLLAPLLDPAIASVRALLGRADGLPPKMRGLLAGALREFEAVRAEGPGAARVRAIAEVARGHGSLPTTGAKLSGATAEEVKETARAALDLLKALARVDDDAVAAALDLARPFARRARAAAPARGLLPFDAMLRLARDLLARDALARRRARARFRQILVDEFQDTDPLQYEVLFLLARREPGGTSPDTGPPDPWRSDLEPGRLFIVGDPKQSIYRFRGADIAAYRRAVTLIEACGGTTLELTASFRSPERLLRPINRIFAGWLGPTDRGAWIGDHAPPYVPLESAGGRDAPGGPARLCVWSVEVGDRAAARYGRQAEAAAIAAHIRAQTAARARRPGEFALLFRAATHMDLYGRALRRAGVPCLVDGGPDFAERPEVNDLVAWLRAVASPNDGPALLATLRSPLGAVPDAEMRRFVEGGGRLVATHAQPAAVPAEDDAAPALRRALERLAAFRRAVDGLPPGEVIHRALHDTPLLTLHGSAHDGTERIARLRRAAARARALAREGLSLPEILTQWETAFVAAEEAGPLADETIDAVRLLTVHKAKGLEFEVVFVPDLGRSEGSNRPEGGDVAWLAVAGGPGTPAIALADGRTNAARVLYDLDQARHEEAEERRIFYVACTRAREELFLVNSRRDRKAAWSDRLEVLGCAPADGAWPAEGLLAEGDVEHRIVRPPELPPAGVAPFDPATYVRAAEHHASAARSLRTASRPPIASPSAAARGDETTRLSGGQAVVFAPEGAAELTGVGAALRVAEARPGTGADRGRAARLAGSAIHAALARCDDVRDGAALLAAALGAARHLAATDPAGAAGSRLASRVEETIRGILAGFMASPLPARLASVEVLAREAPILHRDAAGQVWSGTCDLLYRDDEGLVVADYKTADPGVDGAAEDARAHEAQLGLYAEAIRRVFPGERVRGEILFLRAGIAVRLPVETPRPAGRGSES